MLAAKPSCKGRGGAGRLHGALLALITAFFVAAMLIGAGADALAQGVNADFAKAHKAFRAGQMKQAAGILIAIVRKFPDHQPSHLLLGRIAFRAGKIGRAAHHFRKVPVDMVTADVAYEYGVTMFTQKNCRRANAAFARVPTQSRVAQLAYFYRGVCFLRGREYQRAELMLKRASKLPSHLQRSRNEALMEVRRQISREQRGQAPSNHYITVPSPPVQVLPNPPSPGEAPPPVDAAKAAPTKPPPPPPPKSGFENSATPSLTYEQANQVDEYFGTSVRRSDAAKTVMALGLQSVYSAAPLSSGQQPRVTFGLDLTQLNISSKGVRTKYIVYANDPGNVIEQDSTDVPAISPTQESNYLARVELSYPAAAAIDLNLGFGYFEALPHGKSDEKYGTQTPYVAFNVNGDVTNFELRASQAEGFAAQGPAQTDVTIGAKLTRSGEMVDFSLAFNDTTSTMPKGAPLPPYPAGETQVIEATLKKSWEDFSMVGSAKNTTYTPAENQVKELDQSNLKLGVTGTKTLDFGATLTLGVSHIILNDYTRLMDPVTPSEPTAAGLTPFAPAWGEREEKGRFVQDGEAPPVKVPIKAQGSANNVVLSFKLTPVDWGYVQASYDYTERQFQVSDPLYAAAWMQANIEVTSIWKFALGLSKSF